MVHSLNHEGYISDEVCEDVLSSSRSDTAKAGELVKGIIWRVKQDSTSYHKFVAKLKEFDKVYEPIVGKLEAEYHRQGM